MSSSGAVASSPIANNGAERGREDLLLVSSSRAQDGDEDRQRGDKRSRPVLACLPWLSPHSNQQQERVTNAVQENEPSRRESSSQRFVSGTVFLKNGLRRSSALPFGKSCFEASPAFSAFNDVGRNKSLPIILTERLPQVFVLADSWFRAYCDFIQMTSIGSSSAGQDSDTKKLNLERQFKSVLSHLGANGPSHCLNARNSRRKSNGGKLSLSKGWFCQSLPNGEDDDKSIPPPPKSDNIRRDAEQNTPETERQLNVRFFDCGSNGARFLNVGQQDDERLIARFPSDHHSVPASLEVLFRECVEVKEFIAQSPLNCAIILVGNDSHRVSLLNLLQVELGGAPNTNTSSSFMKSNNVNSTNVLFYEPVASNGAGTTDQEEDQSFNTLNLQISRARKSQEVLRLFDLYKLNGKKFNEGIVVEKVIVECDYARLCDAWEKTELKRHKRRPKKGANQSVGRTALNVLMRDSFEPFLMITNDADVMYHSAQGGNRVNSGGSSPQQLDNKNEDTLRTSRIEFDVNKSIMGDMRVRIFAKANPISTGLLTIGSISNIQMRRPELCSLWFHSGLMESVLGLNGASISSDSSPASCFVFVPFELSSTMDANKHLQSEADSTKYRSPNATSGTPSFIRVMLVLSYSSGDRQERSNDDIVEPKCFTICPKCFECSQISKASPAGDARTAKHCKCGAFLSDNSEEKLEIMKSIAAKKMEELLDEVGEVDEIDYEDDEGEDEEEEEKDDWVAPAPVDDELIQCLLDMFPNLPPDLIFERTQKHGSRAGVMFNQIVEELTVENERHSSSSLKMQAGAERPGQIGASAASSTTGLSTKSIKARASLTIGMVVQTPVGIGMVENPESICHLIDGVDEQESIRSVRVRFPFAYGYFYENEVRPLFNDSNNNDDNRAVSKPNEARGLSGAAVSPRNIDQLRDPHRRRQGIRFDHPPLAAPTPPPLSQEQLDALLAQSIYEEEVNGGGHLLSSALASGVSNLRYQGVLASRYGSHRAAVLRSLPVTNFEPSPKNKPRRSKHSKRSQDQALELPKEKSSSIDQKKPSKAKKKEQEEEWLNKCLVCQYEFTQGDAVRTLPCFHRFHTECVDEWIVAKSKCPLCKTDVRDANAVEQGLDVDLEEM